MLRDRKPLAMCCPPVGALLQSQRSRCQVRTASYWADNAKLHHMLEFGLSNALRRWIKATIPREGCWTSRSDVMDDIVWWRITGADDVREVGTLP